MGTTALKSVYPEHQQWIPGLLLQSAHMGPSAQLLRPQVIPHSLIPTLEIFSHLHLTECRKTLAGEISELKEDANIQKIHKRTARVVHYTQI